MWPSNRADSQHWARVARAALSQEAWRLGWSAGAALGAESLLDQLLSGAAAPAEEPSAQHRTVASGLTRPEREVAKLAAQGLSNRRIGALLVITEKTAANHLQNALDKLGLAPASSGERSAALGR